MGKIIRNDDGKVVTVEEIPVDVEGLFRSRQDCQDRIDIATQQMVEIDQQLSEIAAQARPEDNLFTPDQIAIIDSVPQVKP